MANATTEGVIDTLSFIVPMEYHGIVNVAFLGPMMKLIQIHDSIGRVVAERKNCSGLICGDIILRGSISVDQCFSLNLYCVETFCGQPVGQPAGLQVYGPVGTITGTIPPPPPWLPAPPSVETYLYYTGSAPELATDTICITIILQVGIDPTTDATGRR
jgi:hypothetical protein